MSVTLSVALGATLACTRTVSRPASSAAPSSSVAWDYEIRLTPDAGELFVEAGFAPTDARSLTIDRDAAPFVRDVTFASGDRWTPVDGTGPTWPVPCAVGCRVRYQFALRAAATKIHDPETAIVAGEVTVAPPATWLLRPENPAGRGRFRFHLTTAGEGERFVTGVHAAPDGAPDTFEASSDALEYSSFAAFGALDTATIESGKTLVEVAFARRTPGLSLSDATRWVKTAADTLSTYFQRPYANRVLVIVIPGQPGSPTRGETLGDGGPAVLVRTAGGLTAAATRQDWVVTHELVHASLPSLGHDHAWLGEGIATYVEPVVRSRAGLVSVETFWRDLVVGLPQGLPEAGDQGLERTHTWGRTYWGGSLFCLLADVAIREHTGNARSLDDALRAVAASGADAEAHWTVEHFLDVADAGTGTRVLEDLYRDMALAPGTVDLAALWQRLGVRVEPDHVAFDDRAPLAAVRRAITDEQSSRRVR